MALKASKASKVPEASATTEVKIPTYPFTDLDGSINPYRDWLDSHAKEIRILLTHVYTCEYSLVHSFDSLDKTGNESIKTTCTKIVNIPNRNDPDQDNVLTQIGIKNNKAIQHLKDLLQNPALTSVLGDQIKTIQTFLDQFANKVFFKGWLNIDFFTRSENIFKKLEKTFSETGNDILPYPVFLLDKDVKLRKTVTATLMIEILKLVLPVITKLANMALKQSDTIDVNISQLSKQFQEVVKRRNNLLVVMMICQDENINGLDDLILKYCTFVFAPLNKFDITYNLDTLIQKINANKKNPIEAAEVECLKDYTHGLPILKKEVIIQKLAAGIRSNYIVKVMEYVCHVLLNMAYFLKPMTKNGDKQTANHKLFDSCIINNNKTVGKVLATGNKDNKKSLLTNNTLQFPDLIFKYKKLYGMWVPFQYYENKLTGTDKIHSLESIVTWLLSIQFSANSNDDKKLKDIINTPYKLYILLREIGRDAEKAIETASTRKENNELDKLFAKLQNREISIRNIYNDYEIQDKGTIILLTNDPKTKQSASIKPIETK